MNIQQYYRQAANISLNASLVSIYLPVLFIIVTSIFIPNREIVILTVPFLLYSLICFHSFQLNKERYLDLEKKVLVNHHSETLFEGVHFPITFVPSPSLHLLIYNPDGVQVGEIKDLNSKKYRWFLPYFLDKLIPISYGFFEGERLVAIINIKKYKIDILNDNKEMIGWLDLNGKEAISYVSPTHTFIVHQLASPLFTDVKFLSKEQSVMCRVRKGWLPREWNKFSNDPNVPVLSFKKHQSKEERLAFLALITKCFRYSNH
ncbi:hypothetical protein SM124_19005 [Bacillus sp. 31A1R]|uniref:Uncharacterized protein n=1 Tax=Robertmurraya mangrovi TaxID=3098077 RepID=A0ABU5J392_9BACI|nr:hypothetical protein [Bacillus sp. 31A1R]MDZ5473812.1 hypothetical protein [Bacillus sp. 31A1R]